MRHIAIIGSGPAGYYTAEAVTKQLGGDARVDIFDMLPVPYGLIRSGVAPDHQSIKNVYRRYEKVALGENVRFIGNVTVGRDITIPELQELYDAVVLATGAPNDRNLGIEGEQLSNVFGSATFVGWYNGHPEFANLNPDFSGKHAIVIGMGNVALDAARILCKSEAEFAGSDIVAHALDALRGSNIETITILGRRGPHQIMMTPKELGELGSLERASPRVDRDDLPPQPDDDLLEPGLRKSVNHLRSFAAIPEDMHAEKPIEIHFDMFASPQSFSGSDTVESMVIERTEIEAGRAKGTGETYEIPADLVISCIGYRTSPIPDVPYDERMGRFANDEGRILPGLYCVGWARRGPTGTIGTNRPDGYRLADMIVEDMESSVLGRVGKPGRSGFDAIAAERSLEIVTFKDWQKIDQAEVDAARASAPREKFVAVDKMIDAGR